MTRPAFPPGRYGRRRDGRRPGRWVVPGLAAILVVAAVALAVIGYRRQTGQVQSAVRAFVIGPAEVSVTFEVRKPPRLAATCLVRARDVHGREVGRALVPVAAGRGEVRMTYVLRTTGRAVTGEVPRCTAAKR